MHVNNNVIKITEDLDETPVCAWEPLNGSRGRQGTMDSHTTQNIIETIKEIEDASLKGKINTTQSRS